MRAKLPHRAEHGQLPRAGSDPCPSPSQLALGLCSQRAPIREVWAGRWGHVGLAGFGPSCHQPCPPLFFLHSTPGGAESAKLSRNSWDGAFPELWKPLPEMPPSRKTWEQFTALQLCSFLFFRPVFFFFFITKNLLKLHIFWHQNSSALGLTGHGLTDAFRCGCRSMIQPIPSKVCLSMHPHAPACWIRCSWRCSVILQWEFPPAPLQCAGTCPQKYFWEVRAWPKDGVCGRHAASLSAESALQIFSVLTEQ